MSPDQHVCDQRAQDVAREGSLRQLDKERRPAAEPLRGLFQPQDHVPTEPTGGAHVGVCVCAWACMRVFTIRCLVSSLQYVFDITKDEDEALICLQQRDMKIQRRVGQGENLSIGFGIFRVQPPNPSAVCISTHDHFLEVKISPQIFLS